MAGIHPHQPSEPGSHDLVTHFSHGDHQGFKHLKDLFQLISAEPHVLPPATREKYVSAIAGMATAQLHAMKQHRERNLHDLVQINTEYPAGHAHSFIAHQRFRDAQRQLSSLEDQLAGQLIECALRSSGSDLILFEFEPTAEKLQAAPASPSAPSDSSECHSNIENPALIVSAGCAAASASIAPDGDDGPSPRRTEAPRAQPEIMVPNEDLLDRLYDSEQMRNQTMRTYARQNGPIPSIFRYGIRYVPNLSLPLQPEQERTDYECRTVIMSGLSIGAQLRDVLGVVRGGKLLRATIVQLHGISDSATALVQFANWRHAHAYNEHAKSHAIVLCDRTCSVALADTPSYPMSPASMNALEQGSTRCFEIKAAPAEEVGSLINSLRRWFPRVQDMLEDVVLDLGGNKVVLRFRDLDFATKVYRLVKNSEALFPVSHNTISFVADPCDKPFKTLNEPQTTTDEGICLMDVIGNPSWDIQSTYPDLGQAAEHNLDDDTSNPSSLGDDHTPDDDTPNPSSPPVADHAPDHTPASSPDHEGCHESVVEGAQAVRNAIDEITADPNWIYTDAEYQELRGFTSFLKDPKEWSENIGYWMGRTRKDLKAQI
ncbi:hypothetical protein PG994_011331 [Apiospora phragmitis]|uniref:Uncharacterized protein n=1 Tax=Apiospora phragmitis TaxID=2905665 RepID=A0ABR1TSJ9_9PEZI